VSSQPLSIEPSGTPALASWTPFAAACLLLAAAAALLAGWAPLGFSIVTVFLFAGPHNWFEVRYFLTRLPARWGKQRPFFLLGFAGIFGLTLVFASLLVLVQNGQLEGLLADHGVALWQTLLLLWIATLTHLRSRQTPRRDWAWIWPVCLGLCALAWQMPSGAGLALVYLHPLMAFWLLDRELRRSRPEWRRPFHWCLLAVPLCLAALWWHLADAPPLPNDFNLQRQITDHAGSSILTGISSHLLVATHTFLEMLHYGVWVVAIPLVGMKTAPWQLNRVPLARRGFLWKVGVVGFLGAGLAVVLGLWGCFLADYATTRTIYFTVALLHVLAEVPFLLRAL
jgi:hypothetical protein